MVESNEHEWHLGIIVVLLLREDIVGEGLLELQCFVVRVGGLAYNDDHGRCLFDECNVSVSHSDLRDVRHMTKTTVKAAELTAK